MSIPDKVRENLRAKMWSLADQIGWVKLSPADKRRHYENWTRDPKIGGLIAKFTEKEHVRVYLKDTIMKDYTRELCSDPARARSVLKIDDAVAVEEVYEKPHGQRLADGRVICWGKADSWKALLMALHERTYSRRGTRPFGLVLTQASGRFQEQHTRALVQDAATKLRIENVIWLDT